MQNYHPLASTLFIPCRPKLSERRLMNSTFLVMHSLSAEALGAKADAFFIIT